MPRATATETNFLFNTVYASQQLYQNLNWPGQILEGAIRINKEAVMGRAIPARPYLTRYHGIT